MMHSVSVIVMVYLDFLCFLCFVIYKYLGRICRCPNGKTLLYGKRCVSLPDVTTLTTFRTITTISSSQQSLDAITTIPINTKYQRSTSDNLTFAMMIVILVLCTLLGVTVMLVYFQVCIGFRFIYFSLMVIFVHCLVSLDSKNEKASK